MTIDAMPIRRIAAKATGFFLLIWGPAFAAEPYKAEIDAVRAMAAKYQDVYAAVHDGYLSTVGCVHYTGEKIPGRVDYDKGAMGIHFVKIGGVGPEVDPMNPPILVYEQAGKELRLVAVEYFVPVAPGVKRPTLFGQPFQGPMEGHEPLIPREVVHYDLHLWLKDNPNGMFSATNPNVSCAGHDFELLEEPTKLVPEK